ncbi:hypothetical protein [uncultured Salegentibacter sp.]|uniref:hypothetical protein n=1 Tax=uncultured Salegentibacter sp. TaxID=259320 RepID=UPI002593F00A|nr:hypothetical protein [uncultured Salegentibacter sp.]
MKLKRIITITLFLFLILNLVSCASGGAVDTQAGFFGGLWDGFIIINSLIASIFDSSINLIAENNSGAPYYIGWGVGLIIGIPAELISLVALFSLISK